MTIGIWVYIFLLHANGHVENRITSASSKMSAMRKLKFHLNKLLQIYNYNLNLQLLKMKPCEQ